ncbi:MAG: hypothetical protein ACKOB4_01965 [Acidobacteriota bacterium]
MAPKRKIGRQFRQLSPITSLRPARPPVDLTKMVNIIQTLEQRRVLGLAKPLQAEIVGSSLQVGRPELSRKNLLKKRDIFILTLLL